MPASQARAWTYAVALLFAVAIACDLLWMPIQVGDSLGEILDAQRSPSVWASFFGSLTSQAYLRPLRIAQIKALFDAAGGQHYTLVYRGVHALTLVAAVALFVRALRVKTVTDASAAVFALAVLTGLHTFRGTVQEAFPINHFLEIAVFCLIVLNLAQSRGGLVADVGAAVTFVVAALTLESGLLVWVVAAAAWLAGARGISWRGLTAMTVLLVAYIGLRFGYLATGVPGLTERSSGFGFAMLDPPELQQRFGAHVSRFYAYNVVSSALSVLFAEPQSGVFGATRDWLQGRLLPRAVIPVVTSTITTALIVWTAVRARLRGHAMDDAWRLVIVGVAVLGASAVLSYAYTKDEIMSTAGVFYALAAFAAMRAALGMASEWRGGFVLAILLALLAIGWSVRSAGLHFVLRSQASKHQMDWVGLPAAWRRDGHWPADPAAQRLIEQLRADAIASNVPNTRTGYPEWANRLWVE